MENKNHLIIIFLLVSIFTMIMFLSVSNRDVVINYNFKENIKLDHIPEYNSEINIGEVFIENNGILPAKVKLDNLILCQISDYFGDETIFINYRGKLKNQYNNFIFNSENYEYVELSSDEQIILDITPNFNKYTLTNSIEKYDLNNKILTFYLFENTEGSRYNYGFCSSAKKEDAIKTIKVELNLSKEELNKLGIDSLPKIR